MPPSFKASTHVFRGGGGLESGFAKIVLSSPHPQETEGKIISDKQGQSKGYGSRKRKAMHEVKRSVIVTIILKGLVVL